MTHHFSAFFRLTRLKSRFIIRAKGVRRVFYVDIHLQKYISSMFYVDIHLQKYISSMFYVNIHLQKYILSMFYVNIHLQKYISSMFYVDIHLNKYISSMFYVNIHLQKDIIFGFYVCRMACKQGRVNRIDRNMRIRGVGIVRLHDMKCFEFAGHVSTMDERRGYRLIS